MKINQTIQSLDSEDAHVILDGVWAVLDCTDVGSLRELLPHVKQWRSKIEKIDLGGAFYRNSNYFNLAMSYIEDMCNGGCHCSIYGSASLISPEFHEKKRFVSISNTEVDVEKYETHFDVQCSFCEKNFKVTEFIGGHVPWYRWHAV